VKAAIPQRTVVITGAAGTLGSALARQLLDVGWTVFGSRHRSPLPLEHPNLHPFPLDVTDPTAWEDLAARLAAAIPHLDALIHSAGIARDRLLAHATLQDWDETFATNVHAIALGTRALLPLLKHAPIPHVLCISSLASRAGGTGQSAYAASKAALNGLATALARELSPDGIRVNTLFPGALVGTMTDKLSPSAREHLAAANLLGSLNDPTEVARFAAFLLSTRQISGQVFNLDSRIPPGSAS
jgi:3-oxoacyl-[acyl-carrier protein] reductase